MGQDGIERTGIALLLEKEESFPVHMHLSKISGRGE